MDRRQNNGSVKAVSPRHCAATCALRRNCCFNCRAWGRVTKTMSVRCTAVEEQPEAKEVQLSQRSSTSLLVISSGLRVQFHLPFLISPGTLTCCHKLRCRERITTAVQTCPGLKGFTPHFRPSWGFFKACLDKACPVQAQPRKSPTMGENLEQKF